MHNFKAGIEVESFVEDFQCVIAVGAAGNDGLGAGLLDSGDVFLGLVNEFFFVAHLESAAAAADFRIAQDTEVHAGFSQDVGGSLGYLPLVFVKAGLAADEVEDVHLRLCWRL